MTAVSLGDAKKNLEAVVSRVLADAEPIVVNTPSGESVVMLPLDDFEAWQETNYLRRAPANAEHLRKSISQAEAGKLQTRNLIE